MLLSFITCNIVLVLIKTKDMKTKIAYYIIVKNERSHTLHEQYIASNELYLIAKFFKEHEEAYKIDVFQEHLSVDHWLFK